MGFFWNFFMHDKHAAKPNKSERFENKGTTVRETEVTRLLRLKIPGVDRVRFYPSDGAIFVTVDMKDGRKERGGYVNGNMTVYQQVAAIYNFIQNTGSI